MFSRSKVVVHTACMLALAGIAGDLGAQHHQRRADIVDTAVGAGDFTTLAAALEAADLVSTLKSRGPFTVFAPTDEAFAKLPSGTLETLLKPENRATLTAILTHHVVPSRVTASRVSTLNSAETVGGQRVDITTEGGMIRVDGATVINADIRASNGIIHVIDEVMIPEDMSIVGIAKNAGTFSTLLAAAEAAGLAGTLDQDGPFTVFAPTDEAFAKLPEGTVESLLAEEGLGTLRQILQYHVIEGRVFSDAALLDRRRRTLARERVNFSIANGQLRVNDAAIVAADVDASNGVVHVIDEVLLPEDLMTTEAPARMETNEAGSVAAARDLIRLAIERGVPVFNAGNAGACAAIYEVAATSLINGSFNLPSGVRSWLERGLRDARRAHNNTDRAWALREGLDGALNQLDGRMASARH